jgi:hypothetical protein
MVVVVVGGGCLVGLGVAGLVVGSLEEGERREALLCVGVDM